MCSRAFIAIGADPTGQSQRGGTADDALLSTQAATQKILDSLAQNSGGGGPVPVDGGGGGPVPTTLQKVGEHYETAPVELKKPSLPDLPGAYLLQGMHTAQNPSIYLSFPE